ncbi:MAG: response regulator [Planctomycetes bacterium]|nr:response regulator [Planctomycetota bacterium]
MFKWFRAKKTSAKKILIIDDEPIIVRTLQDRLKFTGYEVFTAADGEEGLQKAVQQKPDLVLLDIMMPKLDGHQVLERMRQMEDTREIPVIMLTARSQMEDVIKATSGGSADYVVKPFDLVALLEKIDKVLSG